jgi:hypothetical protein
MKVNPRIGLENCYSLLALYAKQLGEARLQLGKLHSQLERKRNYVRVCDLPEKTDEE